MFDPLSQLTSAQLEFVAVMSGMVLTALTVSAGFFAVQWRKIRLRELELAFKDDLLERGITAEDVELLWSGKRPGFWVSLGRLCQRGWQSLLTAAAAGMSACRWVWAQGLRALSGIRADRRLEDRDFKNQLLDRGLSVEEIERVLAAGRPSVVEWARKKLLTGLNWSVNRSHEAWQWCRERYAKFVETRHAARDRVYD